MSAAIGNISYIPKHIDMSSRKFHEYITSAQKQLGIKFYMYQICEIDRGLACYSRISSCSLYRANKPSKFGSHGIIYNLEMGLGKTIITLGLIFILRSIYNEEVFFRNQNIKNIKISDETNNDLFWVAEFLQFAFTSSTISNTFSLFDSVPGIDS